MATRESKTPSSLLLSQEQDIIDSIMSIQDFYQLKDHRRLIEIILNPKQSQRLFGEKKVMMADVFEKQVQSLDDDSKASIFAEKYTYENLVQKFKKPKSFRNNLLIKILAKKMQKQVIGSHQTRKKIWLLASGAMFSMKNNKGLFQGLIDYPDYPKYFEKSIGLDLPRTVKSVQTREEDTKSLKNILTAFSRRNPYIGYCQGLNFIAYFLLTMQFTDEESFWILSQITETVIPMDYYTNMVGVACDQQIFMEVLSILKPKISKKFLEVGLDGTMLCIQWFVCLFTSSLPFYLVKVVWDRLLVEGVQVFIKTGIIILSKFEREILQTEQFYEIIMIVEQGSKNLQISEEDFNKEFDKIYINNQGLKIARDLYREFHIKDKLMEKMIDSKKKKEKVICSLEWPLCIESLLENRRTGQEIQIWTYRQESSPKIIHDYLENSRQRSSSTSSSSTIVPSIQQERVLLSKASSVKYNTPSEYVIGRMEHICHEHFNNTKIQQRKFKKNKKNNTKFLSMIVEGQEQQEEGSKRIENIKKILRQSTIQFENGNDESEIVDYETVRHSSYQSDFHKSDTIEFYTNFVQNNKALAQMLVGKSQIFEPEPDSPQKKQQPSDPEQPVLKHEEKPPAATDTSKQQSNK